jgi:hypothetical protein
MLKWFNNHDEKSGVDYVAINPEHVVSVLQDLPAPDGTPLTQIYVVTDLVYTVVGKSEDIVGRLNERDV